MVGNNEIGLLFNDKDLEFTIHLVGLRPLVYYSNTLTNFRGGGKAPLRPPSPSMRQRSISLD